MQVFGETIVADELQVSPLVNELFTATGAMADAELKPIRGNLLEQVVYSHGRLAEVLRKYGFSSDYGVVDPIVALAGKRLGEAVVEMREACEFRLDKTHTVMLNQLEEAARVMSWDRVDLVYKTALLQEWTVARARMAAAALVLRVEVVTVEEFYLAAVNRLVEQVGPLARNVCEFPHYEEHLARYPELLGTSAALLTEEISYLRARQVGAVLILGCGGGQVAPEGYSHAPVLHVDDYRFLLVHTHILRGVAGFYGMKANGGYRVVGVGEGGMFVPYVHASGLIMVHGYVQEALKLTAVVCSTVFVPIMMAREGYCYLKLVPPELRMQVGQRLGVWPEVEELTRICPEVFTWSSNVAQLAEVRVRHGVDPLRDESAVVPDERANVRKHVLTEGVLADHRHQRARLGGGATTVERLRGVMDGMLLDMAVKRSAIAKDKGSVIPSVRVPVGLGVVTGSAQTTALSKYGQSVVAQGSGDRGVEFGKVVGPAESAFYPSARRVSGRGEEDRMEKLQVRLEKGTVVSRAYVSSSLSCRRLRRLSDGRGEVIMLPGADHDGPVRRPNWVRDTRFCVQGWSVHKTVFEQGCEYVIGPWPGAKLSRVDITSAGRLKFRSMVADTAALVVWLRGEERVRYDGEKTTVRLFTPDRGVAVGLGWSVELLQGIYPVPVAKEVSGRSVGQARLRVPLVEHEHTDLGLSRYKARYYVKDSGFMRVHFECEGYDPEVPAVISVSGGGLRGLSVGGVTSYVKRGHQQSGQAGMMAVGWQSSCVLEISSPGEVRFTVDYVRDRVKFEEAHVVAAATPVLSQLALPSRGQVRSQSSQEKV